MEEIAKLVEIEQETFYLFSSLAGHASPPRFIKKRKDNT